MDTSYAVFAALTWANPNTTLLAPTTTGRVGTTKPRPTTKLLRAVFDQLATHGPTLIVVDQPNTIGALPVTVARACGHQVTDLPGLSMRRIADLYLGQAKTDACDAFIIADTARTKPHTLSRVDTGDDTVTELGMLVGFDDDPAGEATPISNRIRGPLTSIHPSRTRAGPTDHPSGGVEDPSLAAAARPAPANLPRSPYMTISNS